MTDRTAQNETAKHFKSLHVPGKPLICANCHDGNTAKLLLDEEQCKVIATASHAIAECLGTRDEDLTYEENMASVKTVVRAMAAHKRKLPLTVDIQDGYGDHLEESIKGIIELGAVGCNLEDIDRHEKLYDADVAAERVKRAMAAAKEAGVPDFVINARTDCLSYDKTFDEVISRAKSFLDAGATTALVWGGEKLGGTRDHQIVEAVKECDGRVAVIQFTMPGFNTIPEIIKLGVARISVGPQIKWALDKKYTEIIQGMFKEGEVA